MSNALAAHGPDAKQKWLYANVGLGQNLMWFTPEDRLDTQLPEDVNAGRVIVGDVRIDNRHELSGSLGISDAAARELSDLALILHAYDKWGAECAGRLIGAFVFALYDRFRQHLMIARSPMGERSLFCYETPDIFAFATAPKGLFALPGVPHEINLETIADFLAWVPREAGSSFFSRIRQLQPGHLMIVGPGTVRSHAFRQLEVPRERRYPRDADYVEEFNLLFHRVVSDHSRCSSQVGIMLSGGLDSASVAATAAPILAAAGKRLNTFTSVPPPGFSAQTPKGWYADETPLVMAVAGMYDNLDPHFLHTAGRFYLDHLNEIFAAVEAPLPGLSNWVWLNAICHDARRSDVRVLLNGMSGNLTISWDGQQLLPNLLRQGKWRAAVREARSLSVVRGSSGSTARLLAGQGLLPLLPRPFWYLISQLRSGRFPRLSPRPVLQNGFPILPEFEVAQRVSERAREKDFHLRYDRDPASRARLLIQMADQKADRQREPRERFGIEYRDPSADLRIVEFCLSVPEDQFLRSGVPRSLIRRAMADRLPAVILQNQTRGLQAADWLNSLVAARARVVDELARIARSTLARNIVDIPRLRRMVEQIPDPQKNSPETTSTFRDFLERGIGTGSFLAWFEGVV